LVSDEHNSSGLKLSDILVFWSGADRVPPGGFEHKLQLQFYSRTCNEQRRLPSSSTCALILWLPRDCREPDDLMEMLKDAVTMSAGFGKV